MIKLSEVCRIVGITRKALRGYNEIGWIQPVAKTEAGYWLYDNDVIEELLIIKLLSEIGLERAEIRKIMENPNFDIEAVFKIANDKLEQQRQQVNGRIKMLKAMQLWKELPETTKKVIEPYETELGEFNIIAPELTFSDRLSLSRDGFYAIEEEWENVKEQGLMTLLMGIIAGLYSIHVEDTVIYTCTADLCDVFLNIFPLKDLKKKEIPRGLQAAITLVGFKKMFSYADYEKAVSDAYGVGAINAINVTLEKYGKKCCETPEEFENYLNVLNNKIE